MNEFLLKAKNAVRGIADVLALLTIIGEAFDLVSNRLEDRTKDREVKPIDNNVVNSEDEE